MCVCFSVCLWVCFVFLLLTGGQGGALSILRLSLHFTNLFSFAIWVLFSVYNTSFVQEKAHNMMMQTQISKCAVSNCFKLEIEPAQSLIFWFVCVYWLLSVFFKLELWILKLTCPVQKILFCFVCSWWWMDVNEAKKKKEKDIGETRMWGINHH